MQVTSALVVPTADQFGIMSERLGRGKVGWVILRPQTREGITKGRDTAFGGCARTGQDGYVLCGAKELSGLVERKAHGFAVPHGCLAYYGRVVGCTFISSNSCNV